MSVTLKRSEGVTPPECPYGCCTDLYGKNVKNVRRIAKRRSERKWKKELRSE